MYCYFPSLQTIDIFQTEFYQKQYMKLEPLYLDLSPFCLCLWTHFVPHHINCVYFEFQINWYIILVKDTVTIFKFLLISNFFSNRWFRWDNANCVSSLSLTNNCWVWILLFWGQSRWFIPMTSSIEHSKRLFRIGKNIFSQNRLIFGKNGRWILFYITYTSWVPSSDSPKSYRKVRKISMG